MLTDWAADEPAHIVDGCVSLNLESEWVVVDCAEPRLPICEMSFTVIDPDGMFGGSTLS